MNIQRWTVDQLMQLPACCFGRRWWVGCYCTEAGGDIAYFTAEEKMPEQFVIWGSMISVSSPAPVNPVQLTFRLGDRVPVTAAEALAMDRLYKGISSPAQLYEFYHSQWDMTWMACERIFVQSVARRLIVVTIGDGVNAYHLTAAVLISSVPKEVPDWLISAQGKNLI